MCHYINSCSVNTYLSGISQQLEPNFPAVREAQNSSLVCHTLRGCMRMKGTATVCKRPLSTNNLHLVALHHQNSTPHNDKLFVAMLFTGFFGLLWLGKMTFPYDSSLHNWKKVIYHNTVQITDSQYEFSLSRHKADQFLKEIASLSWHNDSNNILSTIFANISTLATTYTLLPHPYR